MPLTSSPARLLVRLDDLLALGLAHLLHDDLLRGLRRDAAELDGLHRLLDEAADLGVRIDVDSVLEAQLARRLLELLRVVGEHLPAPKRLVAAGRAIDRDAHLDVVAVALARGGRERRLDRFEDHRLSRRPSRSRRRRRPTEFLCSYLVTDLASLRRRAAPRRCRSKAIANFTVDLEQHVAAVRCPRAARSTCRRPSRASFSSTFTCSPTKRSKCASVRNRRSKPGDDTSST